MRRKKISWLKGGMFFWFLIGLVFYGGWQSAFSYPVSFSDARGHVITIQKRPSCVVSLVPSVTEMLFRIGAGDAVKGLTRHTIFPKETACRQVVGGFFSPSLSAIEALGPEVIFLSTLHGEVRARFQGGPVKLVELEARNIDDIYNNINILGAIFDVENEAAELVAGMKNALQVIKEKVDRIPESKRKRVIRLMGQDRVMSPGDDSFQNAFIRLAGGIPPRLNKRGGVVAVGKEEWMRFNPQIIYGCGGDRETARRVLSRPGWRDVEAVKEGKIFFFPCDLTCRPSTRAPLFISWLSARIYEQAFSKKENQVLEDEVLSSRPLELDLDFIKEACITYSRMVDFPAKTLVIDFNAPQTVVSTLEGEQEGILSVGNHSFAPPGWVMVHDLGPARLKDRVCRVLGKVTDRVSLLFTGADMDHLVVEEQGYREMKAYALVTAGVLSNAMRMSQDEGLFYGPGTVNILLLSNRRLTPRAMTRAVISATEAKTAALQDLDIRSSYTPGRNQATGTGTDNVMVTQGTGPEVQGTGGHSKMGELMARAVYRAVKRAVSLENGLVPGRNIFQRLQERGITFYELISVPEPLKGDPGALARSFEALLLDTRYAAFLEASLAVCDNHERGLIHDLQAYDLWCRQVASEIGGAETREMVDFIVSENISPTMEKALNALLNGLYARISKSTGVK